MTAIAQNPKFSLAEPAVRIAPSLLSADFSQLAEDVAKIEAGGAAMLHLDVMDGHFVPNISFGVPVIRSLRPRTRLFFDAHLMISEPARYAGAFIKAGCDHLTFHIEVADKPRELVDEIHRLGVSAGVCLNPTTPMSAIEQIVDVVDLVLVMTVNPGFGGQKFIPGVLPKLAAVRRRIAASGREIRLEIDGGVKAENIAEIARAGADTFVAGSAIFGAKDYAEVIRLMRAEIGGALAG